MSEDFASISPSSSPSPAFPSSIEHYSEVEKHIQACQDIFFDDVATRNKALGIDLSTINVDKLNNGILPHSTNLHNSHSNGLHSYPSLSSNSHSLHSLQPNGNHTFKELDLDDDEDDDHLTLNSHLNTHLNGTGNHHLPHHQNHSMHHHHRDAGSNSSTDTEEGLGGYDLKNDPLSVYDDTFPHSDPDTFLNSKHPDLNGNGTHSDPIDSLDVIADDMPAELDITKHTQDAPMQLKSHMVGGLLNTHMLISPRHMMGV